MASAGLEVDVVGADGEVADGFEQWGLAKQFGVHRIGEACDESVGLGDELEKLGAGLDDADSCVRFELGVNDVGDERVGEEDEGGLRHGVCLFRRIVACVLAFAKCFESVTGGIDASNPF